MDNLSDNALMLKVKAGSIDQLGLLYERHKQRLFGFFYQMNHNGALSEDLVQNVFMRILKYKHTYTSESKFMTWMYHIARNVSYDDFKKHKSNRHSIELSKVDNRLNADDDIQKEIISKENSATLKTALDKLSFDKREVLVLSKLKTLKYREVGEIIGCSEGAARTKVHRALNDLKDIFFELENR